MSPATPTGSLPFWTAAEEDEKNPRAEARGYLLVNSDDSEFKRWQLR